MRASHRRLGALVVAAALAVAGCSVDLDLDGQSLTVDGPGATPTPGPGPTPTVGEPVPTPEGTGVPTPTPVEEPDDLPLDVAIEVAFADVEAYWAERFVELYGIEFTPVADKIPYWPSRPETLPACAGETAPPAVYMDNAFYCPPDDIIAWDAEGLFPDLYATFGDFAVALVIAHEYGHAVQSRVGWDFGPTIFIELQADCLAGAWAGAVDRGESPTGLSLSPKDLEGAIGGYLTFADPIGTPAGDPHAHGSGFDRVRAFIDGYSGDAEVCGDYLTSPPDVAEISFDPFDPNEGDMPLAELEPLLIEDLDTWWATDGAALLGIEWEPPRVLSYGDPAGAPPCDGRDPPRELAAERGYYCIRDNLVAYEAGAFQQDLFGASGDMAATYVLLHLYGQSLAVAQGLTDPGDVVLRADCLAGVWLADVYTQVADREERHLLFLSAGDLDEAIVGSVSWEPNGPSLQPPGEVRAFDRIAALSTGFFVGADDCP